MSWILRNTWIFLKRRLFLGDFWSLFVHISWVELTCHEFTYIIGYKKNSLVNRNEMQSVYWNLNDYTPPEHD